MEGTVIAAVATIPAEQTRRQGRRAAGASNMVSPIAIPKETTIMVVLKETAAAVPRTRPSETPRPIVGGPPIEIRIAESQSTVHRTSGRNSREQKKKIG